MKGLLRKLKPDSFEDIVAVLALYRPGPLKSGLVDRYINRKHGREPVEYPFPQLEEVLRETYGVIVYQEQVMKMSQILAGFTPGEADTLRKAIGKKKRDLMEEMKEKFIRGAVERGFPEEKVRRLWEDIEKFASYSFNKSHSVAYGYISYWTAYMKAHYPEEFFAVKLTTEKNDVKFINLIKDAKLMDFEILPPDINRSGVGFHIEGSRRIRFGIGRIKGVGEDTARAIVEARGSEGFRGLQDFVRRVDSRKVNRKVLEALVKAGAFDFTGKRREELLEMVEEGRSLPSLAQSSLFGETQKRRRSGTGDPLRLEKEVMGPLEELENLGGGTEVSVAGVVTSLQVYMAVFNLIDRTGVVESVVFPDVYEASREKLREDGVVVCRGTVEEDIETENLKLLIREILLPEEVSASGTYLNVYLKREDTFNGKLEKLRKVLEKFRDPEGKQVVLHLHGEDFLAVIHPSPDYRVDPSPQLLDILTAKLGFRISL